MRGLAWLVFGGGRGLSQGGRGESLRSLLQHHLSVVTSAELRAILGRKVKQEHPASQTRTLRPQRRVKLARHWDQSPPPGSHLLSSTPALPELSGEHGPGVRGSLSPLPPKVPPAIPTFPSAKSLCRTTQTSEPRGHWGKEGQWVAGSAWGRPDCSHRLSPQICSYVRRGLAQ